MHTGTPTPRKSKKDSAPEAEPVEAGEEDWFGEEDLEKEEPETDPVVEPKTAKTVAQAKDAASKSKSEKPTKKKKADGTDQCEADPAPTKKMKKNASNNEQLAALAKASAQPSGKASPPPPPSEKAPKDTEPKAPPQIPQSSETRIKKSKSSEDLDAPDKRVRGKTATKSMAKPSPKKRSRSPPSSSRASESPFTSGNVPCSGTLDVFSLEMSLSSEVLSKNLWPTYTL